MDRFNLLAMGLLCTGLMAEAINGPLWVSLFCFGGAILACLIGGITDRS